ncbi:MAG TPA: tetratricopeptide repeat protein [Pyrinomonadaceae bacterium]|nr:tetratricopeptide repeat protein [Pyrinomonadaceae bacterium]
MKRSLSSLSIASLLMLTAATAAVAQRKPAAQTEKKPAAAKPSANSKTKPTGKAAAAKSKKAAPASEDALKAELDEIVKLDAAARVERLQAFVKENPDTPQTLRAQELLTSARAALGDERLRGGDRAAGVELFRAAVAEAPEGMSDKLFAEVVSQLPANLYVLGEREAGLELARAVEARAAGKAERLLAVAAFYLGVEQPEEAARVARAAVELKPDMAAAHQALGTAHRYALRLDEAAAEFARAVELDPKSAGARRMLAELRRATGKPEEAVTIYREQLAADPQDANARGGLVLSLFDSGRREEAERELQTALTGEAKDLPLLVGASYWYAAHGEGARALELAEKAVGFESRFGWAWARIAQGRALLALGRPLDAERALRAARRFGNFPTLDYELAAALAAAGLYDEAGEQLARSFTVRDGKVEARLAGRVESSAADFNELLAPERRASLSQFTGASPAEEARILKALLAFRQATAEGGSDARAAAEAAREFASGEDEMRAFRNLYAASRLEKLGAENAEVLARVEAAVGGVEPALKLAYAPIALFADTTEVRELRRQVVEEDAPLSMLGVERDVLSRVLRGRIEELAGWALYNQGQTAEAVVRLRRAVSVLPESSEWWRAAEWRLGAALEATGSGRDALAAYIASYRLQPDETRRAVIEALYKRLNKGSAKGLEELLGATAVASTSAPGIRSSEPTPAGTPSTQPAATPAAEPTPATSSTPTPTPEASATPTASPTPAVSATPEAVATPTASPTPEASPSPTPAASPTPEASPSPSPSPTASPTPAAESTPATATPTPEATATPTPEATATPTPEASPTPASEASTSDKSSGGSKPGGPCVLTAGESAVELKANGGSATVRLVAENYTGPTMPRINASTDNWADIIVLAEPHTTEDGTGARFTVSSVSTKTGAFLVNFSSPCGKQQVTVHVK